MARPRLVQRRRDRAFAYIQVVRIGEIFAARVPAQLGIEGAAVDHAVPRAVPPHRWAWGAGYAGPVEDGVASVRLGRVGAPPGAAGEPKMKPN